MREDLLRYLERERLAERRAERELRALPLSDRIECGEALAGLSIVSQGGGRIVVSVPEHTAKFREGDLLWLGDGENPGTGLPVRLASLEGGLRRISLEVDAREEWSALVPGTPLVLDRRSMDLADRFTAAIEEVFAARGHAIVRCLAGTLETEDHETRRRAATMDARARGLDRSQTEAFARALARPRLHLIQGPPGTGKTRLLAEILDACVAAGERVAVVAYTHRAVDQVLIRAAERMGSPRIVKVHRGRGDSSELDAARVRSVASADRLGASGEPIVAGLTTHAACRAAGRAAFDRVVFDEAGQIPLPHAIGAMRLAAKWIFVGDHAQLPPVVAGVHQDEHRVSAFEHLVGKYPSTMLETTYRMNAEVCAFPSRHFYGGKLAPSAAATTRRLALRPGGRFRAALDPEMPSVLLEVDHRGAAMRSRREAVLVAELILELLVHHRLPADEIAAIAPFRAQGIAIRQELEGRAQQRGLRIPQFPFVETVERIQGREREVVILSFTSSDPDWLADQSSFYFLPNRWNVALTRARTKRILVASPLAFAVRARKLEEVPAIALLGALRRETPRLDATPFEREIEGEHAAPGAPRATGRPAERAAT